MTKALAIILALSATASHAALQQPRPETDTRPKPITVYEAPKACATAKRKYITLHVKRLINDKLVNVAVAIVPVEC